MGGGLVGFESPPANNGNGHGHEVGGGESQEFGIRR